MIIDTFCPYPRKLRGITIILLIASPQRLQAKDLLVSHFVPKAQASTRISRLILRGLALKVNSLVSQVFWELLLDMLEV